MTERHCSRSSGEDMAEILSGGNIERGWSRTGLVHGETDCESSRRYRTGGQCSGERELFYSPASGRKAGAVSRSSEPEQAGETSGRREEEKVLQKVVQSACGV